MRKNKRETIVVIGATSGIIKAVMRKLVVEEKYDFSLVGRRRNTLELIKKDLEIRDPSASVRLHYSDDLSDIDFIDATVLANSNPSIVLICVGMLPEQERIQRDLAYLEKSIEANALIPILWLEAFVSRICDRNTATFGVLSSVAADRGRKSNYCYGAAKSLLDTYVQGIQHRFHKSNKSFVLIKPGPTKSPMTKHLDEDNLADPGVVAEDIINAIYNKKPVVYTPSKWWLIMQVIKIIPRQVFNRINI